MNPQIGKFCPACGHENSAEADACLFCGAPLEKSIQNAGISTEKLAEQAGRVDEDTLMEAPTVPPPARGVAIYLAGDATPIAVMFQDEFILGRPIDKAEEAHKDDIIVDLRPYGALEMGVSRRHLKIRRSKDGYEAIDMGSINGSYVYEQRLIPHQPFALFNGALIRMGNLRLFITFRFRTD
ncbi:MAG: FHA domain-containing protein [Anaerolineales bacterium]|nr:FHA domain-containing protein [Anaerolineales bacterium]